MNKEMLLEELSKERKHAIKIKEPLVAFGITLAMQIVVNKVSDDSIFLGEKEYEDLLFSAKQIEQLKNLAVKLENTEIDGFDFGEEVLNIL